MPHSSVARWGVAPRLSLGRRKCGPGFSWPWESKSKALKLTMGTMAVAWSTSCTVLLRPCRCNDRKACQVPSSPVALTCQNPGGRQRGCCAGHQEPPSECNQAQHQLEVPVGGAGAQVGRAGPSARGSCGAALQCMVGGPAGMEASPGCRLPTRAVL